MMRSIMRRRKSYCRKGKMGVCLLRRESLWRRWCGIASLTIPTITTPSYTLLKFLIFIHSFLLDRHHTYIYIYVCCLVFRILDEIIATTSTIAHIFFFPYMLHMFDQHISLTHSSQYSLLLVSYLYLCSYCTFQLLMWFCFSILSSFTGTWWVNIYIYSLIHICPWTLWERTEAALALTTHQWPYV